MEEQSFLGLGATRTSLSTSSSSSTSWNKATASAPNSKINRNEPENSPSSTEDESTNATNAAQDLVSRYMKQCLDYHHEQVELEKLRYETQQQQQQQQNDLNDTRGNATMTVSAIPSLAPNINVIPPAATITTTAITIPSEETTTTTDRQPSNDTVRTTQEIQTRIKNARAIAQRFALTTPHPTTSPPTTSTNLTLPPTTTETYPYSQKRNHFLTAVHRRRLQTSLLKNLDYLVRKDTELHERQLQTLRQTEDRSVGLRLQNERALSERRRLLLERGQGGTTRKRNRFGQVPKTVAGIGTQERKNAQRRNVAVYIAGLPRGDGARGAEGGGAVGSETADLEKVLRQLFGSYGIVSRVVLYADKKTGRRKGDGLVAYDYPMADGEDAAAGDGGNKINGHDSFLEMVCSQLNGAQLPCGSVLSVEPADMNYSKKDKDSTKKNDGAAGPGESEISAVSCTAVVEDDRVGNGGPVNDASVKVEAAADDDLDDFFASLE